MDQQTIPPEDSVLAPSQGEGPSNDLPEEYRPYSDIPWDEIPDESREGVLAGLKKFHGGMTKGQQELAELRKRLPTLENDSRMLKELVQAPWVREAWQKQKNGVQEPAEPPPNLSDHLDSEAASAIEKVVSSAIDKRFGPLRNQISSIEQQQINAEAKRELERLTVVAKEKGWPSPQDKLSEMYALVADGSVKTVEDAYKKAAFDDILNVVQKTARESLQSELQKKADVTSPPAQGPNQTPRKTQHRGRDAVLEAFNEAQQELFGR